MKKKFVPDLKFLWERAAKKRNIDSSSTPQLVTVESAAQIQSDSPSVEMQFQPEIAMTELGISSNITEAVASNEPEVARAASTEPGVAASNEHVSLSPVREIDESENESSDEAIYDLDYLCHDPGKRFPIKCYDVNDQNSMIRGYIALGSCQLQGHDFPLIEIGGKP